MRHQSQRVSFWYFGVALGLFMLQVLAGLWIAAQYIWPQLTWQSFAFNIGREWHLNLLVLWLLIGFMGIVYYLLPDETGTELVSVPLAYAQLALLAGTGVAVLIGFIFRVTQGREYLEAPRYAQWLIVASSVIFAVETVMTVLRRRRPFTASLGVILGGLAALVAIYIAGMFFFPNLAVDEFFRWWVVHLWVEGAFELIASGVMAFLLVKLTGVPRERVERWLYLEIGLVVISGLIGVGHHYYWIGTPAFWKWWGAVFSALEPVPIVLMLIDAVRAGRQRQIEITNRPAYLWTIGSAWTHLIGAGVWGFAVSLPAVNVWMHGTQFTAAHGHFAFYGAYAMMVLAFIAFVVPGADNKAPHAGSKRSSWAFWLMLLSMVTMVLVLSGAGLVQAYYWRWLGQDFMLVREQQLASWMIWRFALGWVFLTGLILYLVEVRAGWVRSRRPSGERSAG